MTVCVCIDDRGGISFNGRRQSKDRALISRLCAMGEDIFIKEYSAKLFDRTKAKTEEHFSVCDGICFVECEDASKYMENADRVILYRWNRRYPSDMSLSRMPSELGFSLERRDEFEGSSHERITEEIWIK